jgi:hypothetical protein
MDRATTTPRPVEKRRSPYRAPRLERLGTLADITLSVKNKSLITDGGGSPGMSKTS